MKKTIFLMPLLALAACSSSDSDRPVCRMIGGGGATVEAFPALGANFTNPEYVIDGRLGSFSSLNSPVGTGSSRIRGTLQEGTVRPAGGVPGIAFRGNYNSSLQFTIYTYLQGQLQESGPVISSIKTSSMTFVGRPANFAYDAIEVELDLAGNSFRMDLHELCEGNFDF